MVPPELHRRPDRRLRPPHQTQVSALCATGTETGTGPATATATRTGTATRTATRTATGTATRTATRTATGTATRTATRTATPAESSHTLAAWSRPRRLPPVRVARPPVPRPSSPSDPHHRTAPPFAPYVVFGRTRRRSAATLLTDDSAIQSDIGGHRKILKAEGGTPPWPGPTIVGTCFVPPPEPGTAVAGPGSDLPRVPGAAGSGPGSILRQNRGQPLPAPVLTCRESRGQLVAAQAPSSARTGVSRCRPRTPRHHIRPATRRHRHRHRHRHRQAARLILMLRCARPVQPAWPVPAPCGSPTRTGLCPPGARQAPPPRAPSGAAR